MMNLPAGIVIIFNSGSGLEGTFGVPFTGGFDDAFLTPDLAAQPTRHKADTDSATIRTTAIRIRLLNS